MSPYRTSGLRQWLFTATLAYLVNRWLWNGAWVQLPDTATCLVLYRLVLAPRGHADVVARIPLRYAHLGIGRVFVALQIEASAALIGPTLYAILSGDVYSLDNLTLCVVVCGLLWGLPLWLVPGPLPDAGDDAWSAAWARLRAMVDEEERPDPPQEETRGSRDGPMSVAEAAALFDLRGRYTRADVTRAYRRLSLRWHPDTGIADERMMCRINEAKERLWASLA